MPLRGRNFLKRVFLLLPGKPDVEIFEVLFFFEKSRFWEYFGGIAWGAPGLRNFDGRRNFCRKLNFLVEKLILNKNSIYCQAFGAIPRHLRGETKNRPNRPLFPILLKRAVSNWKEYFHLRDFPASAI